MRCDVFNQTHVRTCTRSVACSETNTESYFRTFEFHIPEQSAQSLSRLSCFLFVSNHIAKSQGRASVEFHRNDSSHYAVAVKRSGMVSNPSFLCSAFQFQTQTLCAEHYTHTHACVLCYALMPGHLAKSLAYDNDMRGRAGAYEVSRIVCVFARVCLARCRKSMCICVFCRGVFSASRSGGALGSRSFMCCR